MYSQRGRTVLESFAWDADDRVIVEDWMPNQVLLLDLKRTRAVATVLADSASYPSLSPNGRWIAYSSPGGNALWLQPIPANGKRYHVASGDITSSHWLPPRSSRWP